MLHSPEKPGFFAEWIGCGRTRRGADARWVMVVICLLQFFLQTPPARAAEIDYQSLQEDPIETVFRRILTQGVPGWDEEYAEDGVIGAELSAIRWPLKEGRIAGLFNPRASKGKRRHSGIDLLAPRGTPIYAALDGIVEVVSNGGAGWRGYGKVIFINHGGQFWSLYSHCDTLGVKIGQRVRQGEQIATVGRTGRASGYHLHFELRGPNGTPLDPMKYLPKENRLPSVGG